MRILVVVVATMTVVTAERFHRAIMRKRKEREKGEVFEHLHNRLECFHAHFHVPHSTNVGSSRRFTEANSVGEIKFD